MEAREPLDELEIEVPYDKYDIVFTIVHSGTISQIQLAAYLAAEEAHNAHNLLNAKVAELVRTNAPIAVSFVSRNADGEIVTSGITGVVGIQHNIPQFHETFE